MSSLKTGETSGIVKTGGGYQIFKLMNKIGGDISPFNKVKSALKIRLSTENFKKIKDEYYEKAGVEIFL